MSDDMEDLSPLRGPAEPGGVQHCTGSMPGGVLMWAQKTVKWPVAPPRSHRQGSDLRG